VFLRAPMFGPLALGAFLAGAVLAVLLYWSRNSRPRDRRS
jgi:hypothetical protein